MTHAISALGEFPSCTRTTVVISRLQPYDYKNQFARLSQIYDEGPINMAHPV